MSFLLDTTGLEDIQQAIETWLQFGTQILSRTAEAIGALIIAVGVLSALFSYVLSRVGGRDLVASGTGRTESIRLQLGRTLGLSLEFLLAADILSTAVAPTWDAIGKLAAIATIRTLLNYFLARELRQEEQRRAAAGPAAGSASPAEAGPRANQPGAGIEPAAGGSARLPLEG